MWVRQTQVLNLPAPKGCVAHHPARCVLNGESGAVLRTSGSGAVRLLPLGTGWVCLVRLRYPTHVRVLWVDVRYSDSNGGEAAGDEGHEKGSPDDPVGHGE